MPLDLSREKFDSLWDDVYANIVKQGYDETMDPKYELLKRALQLNELQIQLICWLYFNRHRDVDIDELAVTLGYEPNLVETDIQELKSRGILTDLDEITSDITPETMDKLYDLYRINLEGSHHETEYVFDREEQVFEVLDKYNPEVPSIFDSNDLITTRQRLIEVFSQDKNRQFQFCKGLLELNQKIESDIEFNALISLAKHFIKKGLTPDTEDEENKGLEMLVTDTLAIVIPFKTDDEWTKGFLLSPDACGKLFYGHPELLNFSTVLDQAEYIRHSDIKKKELFFDERNNKDIEVLSKILRPEKFDSIMRKLEEKGRNHCISVLLHGYPGTGKTELVKQLSRETRRDIILAEPSKLNMSHIGESEKMYRALFLNIRFLQKLSPNAPILLFNEADGVLGKRINVSSSCDKVDNTVQSILLQEMETFEGILVATTNLTNNLDNAFDRRFLLKINFHKPDLATRCKILHSMIPSLDEETVRIIAERYDFSGGQLENIARKIDVFELADDIVLSREDILHLCDNELLSEKEERSGKKVIKGFIEY